MSALTPLERELLAAAQAAFDFLGSVDGAAEVRVKLLAAILKAQGETA